MFDVRWIKFFALFLFFISTLSSHSFTSLDSLWKNYAAAKDSNQRVLLLIKISEESYQNNRKYSEYIAERAFQLAKSYSSDEIKIKALTRLTNVTFENSNNAKANKLSADLLKLCEDFKNPFHLSEAHRIAGRNYHLRGDYSPALDHYFKGLRLAETIPDTIQMGEIYNIIGGVYLNQGDNKNAFLYYNKSLQIQIKKNNALRIGRGYLNISNIYTAAKKYRKALQILDSSFINYSKANYEEGKAMVYTTLPEIYIALHEEDSALNYLYKAYDYLKTVNRTYYLPQLDLQIGKILHARNKSNEALHYLNDGIAVSLFNHQNHELVALYLLKSEILNQLGDPKEAFQNYKLHKQYSDSVFNAASVKKQAEEALKYEFDRKQLKQEIIAQEEARTRKWLLLATSFIILVLLIVFYYRYRLKQKANLLLEQTNLKLAEKNLLIESKTLELQVSLNERELLLKEIHHRVKNNLQVISGLLELQKEELKEDGSKAAFDEGQSRIRSISLIHQNLYQNDKLGSIQFTTFANELIEQVKEVFETTGSELNIHLQLEDQLFDIDTAVPLGLILNELLTNSYKYATNKNKVNNVFVSIENKGNGEFVLNYSDSGPGLKNEADFEGANTLGLRLIKGLAQQLAGKASYHYQQGAVFKIQFKDSAARMKD